MVTRTVPINKPLFKIGAISAVATLLASSAAFSATGVTWNGSTSTDFEAGTNWVGNTAPVSDTTTNYAVFTGAPTVNQPTLTVDRSLGGIQFGSTAGWDFGGAQQLNLGNALTGTVSVDASALTSGTDTISVGHVNVGGTNDGNPSTWLVGTGGTLQASHRVTDGTIFVGNGTSNGTVVLGDGVTAGEDNGSLNVRLVSGTLLLNKVSSAGDHAASELKIYGGTAKVTGTGGQQLYQGGILEVRAGGVFDLNGHSEIGGSLANFGDGDAGGIVDNTSASAASLTLTGGNGWTYNGVIQNSGGGALALIIDNAANNNAVRLTGNSTYSGGTTILSGELRVSGGDNHNNALGTGAITIGNAANTGASATLKYNGGGETTFNNAINIVGNGTNTITADDWNPTFTGNVTLSNSNLTLSSTNPSGSTIHMQGAVTGTGNITISANAANSSSRIEFTGGTVNNAGTITNNGTGIGDTNISATIGSNVTGVIQNSTTSKLVLSGSGNAFGTTTVTAGTLEVSNGSSLGTGAVTVANTGILTLGSFTSINDTGALLVDAGAVINLNFGTDTEVVGSLFSITGNQFVPIGTYTAAQLDNLYGFGAGTFAGTGSIQVTAVPEPTTWALLVSSLLVVVIATRRRRMV